MFIALSFLIFYKELYLFQTRLEGYVLVVKLKNVALYEDQRVPQMFQKSNNHIQITSF